jgi:Na+/melibiose symporter-like transporter
MKKTFKETKLGNLLKNKLPDAINIVGDVLPNNGVLGIVKNIISSSNLSEEDKQELTALTLEMERLENEEMANARNLQIEALKQDDIFSKRFVYYLGSFIIVSATAFGVMMYFVEIPKQNQRLVEMFADIYLFAGAVMVLQFFFGSSQSSKNKDNIISDLKK